MILEKNDFSLLVILTGSLGDLIRGLVITAYIKEKYPKCKISWLVENSLKDIVALDKNIDDVIIFKKKDKLKGFLDTIKISSNAIDELILCGLWNRKIKNRGRGALDGWWL